VPKKTPGPVLLPAIPLVKDNVQRLPEFAGEGGTQIVSYSELDSYRQCPLKHMLSYKERWKKPVVEGSPLRRGSLWHLVMEEHYGVIMASYPNGRDPIPDYQVDLVLENAWEKIKPLLFDPQTGNQSPDQELIQWMYEGYVEKWGVDNDWRIVAIEYAFEVPLPDNQGQVSRYILKGKIDIIAQSRENGGLWIWDHKSGKDLPTAMALEIDDQFGGYTYALNTLGYKVRGSMHNAARTTQNKGDLPGAIIKGAVKKQTLEQRMGRTFLNRTAREAQNLAQDAWAVASNAYPEPGAELPLYSSPDARSCGWKCDYKEIHIIARQGRDIHELMDEYGFSQDFTRH